MYSFSSFRSIAKRYKACPVRPRERKVTGESVCYLVSITNFDFPARRVIDFAAVISPESQFAGLEKSF